MTIIAIRPAFSRLIFSPNRNTPASTTSAVPTPDQMA